LENQAKRLATGYKQRAYSELAREYGEWRARILEKKRGLKRMWFKMKYYSYFHG